MSGWIGSPVPGGDPSSGDLAADLARMKRLLTGAQPDGLTGADLVVAGDGRALWSGTTTPVVATEFSKLPSGLIVPTSAAQGAAPIDAMVTYMTASEVLGEPIPFDQIGRLIASSSTADVLACVGWLTGFLRTNKLVDPQTSLSLVERFFIGEAKVRALALLRSHYVALAPQVLLAVAKLAVILHDPDREFEERGTMRDVIAASLGLADHLGATAEGADTWANQPAGLSMELVSNQHFNASLDEGTAIARFWAHWHDLPRTRDPDTAALHEQAFIDATGVSLEDCFRVGVLLMLHTRATGHAHFSPTFAADNGFTDTDTAAIDLFAVDVLEAQELVNAEVSRAGFDWSANTFRRFPLIRQADGSMTLVDPDFLVQRACGAAAYWELHNHFKKAGKQQWGEFKRFRGLVVEDSIGEGMRSISKAPLGGAKRLWTEEDLQAAWPGVQCCDFVIDFGTDWVCVEVVSHMLSEAASTGKSTADLDKEIRIVVEEKAEQLDAVAKRLIDDEEPLTGSPHVPGRRVLPVLVAGSGFPVNPIMLEVIFDRLAAADLLHHPQIDRLEILDEDNVEQMEYIQENGGPAFATLLRMKQSAGMRAASMDQYLFHELRHRLHRPARAQDRLDSAFEVLSAWAAARQAVVVDPGQLPPEG